MNIEIEKKFLVKGDQWRSLSKGVLYRQGYLSTDIERTVRIRTIGDQAFLTIKGKTVDASRNEFEYEIPIKDANWMLDKLCKHPLIEKNRYKINLDDVIWEVDEFWGENQGLILAEVELDEADQEVLLPDWIGQEVTDDPAYYNANLAVNPYSKWK